jgi:hypothetical protein
MKYDREKALTWSEEHWTVAKCICVCIAIMGLALSGLDIMTSRAALAASVVGIIYVLLLTRHYTGGGGRGRR